MPTSWSILLSSNTLNPSPFLSRSSNKQNNTQTQQNTANFLSLYPLSLFLKYSVRSPCLLHYKPLQPTPSVLCTQFLQKSFTDQKKTTSSTKNFKPACRSRALSFFRSRSLKFFPIIQKQKETPQLNNSKHKTDSIPILFHINANAKQTRNMLFHFHFTFADN